MWNHCFLMSSLVMIAHVCRGIGSTLEEEEAIPKLDTVHKNPFWQVVAS